MKKLVTAACALCAAAVFAGGVESANIVGFNGFAAGSFYNYFAPQFTTVGATTIDINTITLDDGNAGTVGWGDSMVISGPLGNPIANYLYYDGTMNPDESGNPFWGDENLAPVTVSFDAGYGLAVDNMNELEFDIKCAGEVPANDVSFAAGSFYNYSGNPFPAELDINNITLDDGNAGTVGWGDSMVISGPLGNPIANYLYYDGTMNPDESGNPFWGDENLAPVTVSFNPGEGFAIDNMNELTFNIKIAKPYGNL